MAYDLDKWTAQSRPPVARQRWTGPILLLLLSVQGAVTMASVFRDGDDGGTLLPGVVALVLATSLSPFARDAWLGPRTRAMFDEFERDAIYRATHRAYAVLLALVTGLLAWLWLAMRLDWPHPTTATQWRDFAATVGIVGATLPIALAERMVPVSSEPDEENGA